MRSHTKSPILPVLVMVSGVLLIAAAGLWYFFVLQSDTQVIDSQVSDGQAADGIPRVSLEDAWVAYNNGSAIFLDVRGEPYFSEGHIPGALLSTVQDLTNQKTTLDPQAWIIPY